MYLLPCSSCDASIPVSPSQAGNETICPECQTSVTVPKLGDLRGLPRDDQQPAGDLPQGGTMSSAGSMGFVVFGLIAAVCMLVAGFCGIRWSLIEVEMTTEEQIAYYEEQYQTLTAAQLIREFEQMDGDTFDTGGPSVYKAAELEKRDWGQNASIAGGIGLVSLLTAFAIAGSGRRNRPNSADT